ncbi:hypothetical protein J7I98_23735 [Streptomyces sp. ISL-98]|uniref:hypothetical protein n=1 Tax=Streptomyces sp. ISL-98 TaxID=2819192 RepID=UPI001BE5C7ED|nr:hypothetical protein [Streptomyces sp. ISL-98]MBT2508843.1 hypothetical protein [Streptomyces sp. ISL-98]
MPTRLDILHTFLIGALAAAIATGLGYLLLSETPDWWLPMVGGQALILTGSLWIKARRVRERRRLQDMYDAPAFGDDH